MPKNKIIINYFIVLIDKCMNKSYTYDERKALIILEEKMNKKRLIFTIIFVLVAVAVLVSALTVDWMNFIYKNGCIYSFYAKPIVTLLCFIYILVMKKDTIGGWWYLVAAFLMMVVTDVLMSIVPLSATETVGGVTFMIGGILSILAHVLLILRIRCGWDCIKKMTWKRLWLPVVIYGSAVVVLLVLWKDVVRVGHAAIAPAYLCFFCTTMWFAWETVRDHLYPRKNALMMAFAATGWFLCEIVGEVYNLALGTISSVSFCLVWIFYGANVILWALSSVSWDKENPIIIK